PSRVPSVAGRCARTSTRCDRHDARLPPLECPRSADVYALSLHDALPISSGLARRNIRPPCCSEDRNGAPLRKRRSAERSSPHSRDRKSTRLNSSHVKISYAVFCLKKKSTESSLQCHSTAAVGVCR